MTTAKNCSALVIWEKGLINTRPYSSDWEKFFRLAICLSQVRYHGCRYQLYTVWESGIMQWPSLWVKQTHLQQIPSGLQLTVCSKIVLAKKILYCAEGTGSSSISLRRVKREDSTLITPGSSLSISFTIPGSLFDNTTLFGKLVFTLWPEQTNLPWNTKEDSISLSNQTPELYVSLKRRSNWDAMFLTFYHGLHLN